MRILSTTLFSSSPKKERIVRTPFEFDKVQSRARQALTAAVEANFLEKKAKPTIIKWPRPIAVIAFFLAAGISSWMKETI